MRPPEPYAVSVYVCGAVRQSNGKLPSPSGGRLSPPLVIATRTASVVSQTTLKEPERLKAFQQMEQRLVGESVGRLELDDRLVLRLHADLDDATAGAPTAGIRGANSFNLRERLRDVLGLLPADTSAVITLNAELRPLLETLVEALGPDEVKLLNDTIRDVSRYSPAFKVDSLPALLAHLDRTLGDELTVALRPVDHAIPPGNQPLPALAFLLRVQDAAAWGALDNAVVAGYKALGLDPERDIEQIVVAGSPRGTRGEGGIVLALGRFDRAKLSRAIETEKKGVTSKAVGGVTAYLFNEGQRGAGAVAFLDDRTLVVGTQAAVEGAIQSAAEGGKSLRRNETILRLLEQVRPDATFWMVGDQSVLENLPKNVPSGGQQLALAGLRNVSVSGDLEPAISVEINGEAQDEASAKNLADVVRGLVALASLQASQRPELKELAAAVSVASDAQRVRVSARFPYELLDQLHKQAGAGKPGAEDGAAR